MSKKRVYELAKELGVETKLLLSRIQEQTNIEANNHLFALSNEEAAEIRQIFQQKTVAEESSTKRIAPTVIRRRPKKEAGAPAASESLPAITTTAAEVVSVAAAPVEMQWPEEPMALAEPEIPEAPVAADDQVQPEPEVVSVTTPEVDTETIEEAPLPETATVTPAAPASDDIAVALETSPADSPASPALSMPSAVELPVAQPPVPTIESEETPSVLPVAETTTAQVGLPAVEAEEQAASLSAEPETDEAPLAEDDVPVESGLLLAPEGVSTEELQDPDGLQGEDYRPKYADAEVTRRIRPDASKRAQVLDRPLIHIRREEVADLLPRPALGRPAATRPLSPVELVQMMAPQPPKLGTERRERRRTGRRVYDRQGEGQLGAREASTKFEVFTPARKKKRGKGGPVKQAQSTTLTVPKATKRVVKVDEAITVADLAQQLAVKAGEVIKHLMGMGMMATINQVLDLDTATLVASEFGFTVENVAFEEGDFIQSSEDRDEDLVTRPPIVTIMGHIDHGKTSLLDAIRHSNVVATEAGGITQKIGAFVVSTPQGPITFVDTPGHNAFTAMRARGAQVSDLVVLVVAADDGVMDETREAVNHARAAEVPILVAINKIDRPEANPERVRQQLVELNLVPEEWGGETLICDVSAKAKKGIDRLLETIILQSEVLELQANPNKPAIGVVVEAQLDPRRGPVATVIVQDGSLNRRDYVVTGRSYGRVRAMLDDRGNELETAGPSVPVELTGLSDVPVAGDTFNVVKEDKQARVLVEHRQEQERRKRAANISAPKSIEELLGQMAETELKSLKIILKADSQGSVEAIKQALLKQCTKEVEIKVIHDAVGGITEGDIHLASASDAVIIGFSVRPESKAKQLADQEHVTISLHSIIYDVTDWVQARMRGMLPKAHEERDQGRAEVLQLFKVPKLGTIAGSAVRDGKVVRGAHARLVRNNKVIYDGKIASLRHFKDDLREVAQGYECGIVLENFNDVKVGDIIETYELAEIEAKLTPVDSPAAS